MWLRGLNCFEPLFFGNQYIMDNLNIILNGQRDYLSGIQYPDIKLPTLLQTSQEGAAFLADSARTLVTYDNIVVNDAQLREKSTRNDVYDGYIKNLDKFLIPQFSLEHSALSTSEMAEEQNRPSTIKIHGFNDASEDMKTKLKEILGKVKDDNFASFVRTDETSEQFDEKNIQDAQHQTAQHQEPQHQEPQTASTSQPKRQKIEKNSQK